MQRSMTHPKVDAFIERSARWRKEFTALRSVLLGCGLTEELKWGAPCYALDGANVVLMHGFKEYCALMFFKGALLADASGLLIRATENTQATRQMRFTGAGEVAARKALVRAYVQEAIEAERAGLKVRYKKVSEYPVPAEFRRRLDASAALSKAFSALTPGRQRGYLLHFGGAKRSATRASRVDRAIPRILQGLGMDDEVSTRRTTARRARPRRTP